MSIKNTMAKLAALADLYPEGADGSLKIWRDPERAGQEALTLGDCRAIRDELRPPPYDFRKLTMQERRLFEDVRASETGIVLDEARTGQPLTVLRNCGLVDVQPLTISPGEALVTTSVYGRRSVEVWLGVPPAPPPPYDLALLTETERELLGEVAATGTGAKIDFRFGYAPAVALQRAGLVEIEELRGVDLGMATVTMTDYGRRSFEAAKLDTPSGPSI